MIFRGVRRSECFLSFGDGNTICTHIHNQLFVSVAGGCTKHAKLRESVYANAQKSPPSAPLPLISALSNKYITLKMPGYCVVSTGFFFLETTFKKKIANHLWCFQLLTDNVLTTKETFSILILLLYTRISKVDVYQHRYIKLMTYL